MNKELLINSTPGEIVIALLEDRKLVEIIREKRNNSFAVGDIYLGKVKKVMPGLNAAFVDVGYEKDAFLHYLDLGPQVNSFNKLVKTVLNQKNANVNLGNFETEPEIKKDGKIGQVLTANQLIAVQIAKEPISTKGPRISTEISLAGRYLVLVPFADKISISQKISDGEERNRLKKLIQGIKPKGFGVIIRTVAQGKHVTEIEQDLQESVDRWSYMIQNLNNAQPKQKLLGEINRTSALLRDLLNDDFNSIVVNDENLMQEVKTYIHQIAPEKEKIVKLYKGKEEIFDAMGVERQIKSSFGRTVNFKSGAYLIIDHTEAMHVIDVNSGHRNKSEHDQETNALDTNIEAAQEIARQLRLRDMGGIIVVDFIDLYNANNRKILFDKLKDEMKLDRAKHTILPPSKFGLIQITRQRVRPELKIETLEKCPTCLGTGQIQPSILITDDIENNLRYLIREQNVPKVELCVNPLVEAFIKKGFPSMQMKWYFRYKKWVKVRALPSYPLLSFKFLDHMGEEFKLS